MVLKEKPSSGETVKEAVPPSSTLRVEGVIAPPSPADAVTIKVGTVVKLATTEQSAVMLPEV
jgi:hypothetical protein